MKERQQSTTTHPMPFLLVSSTDHITPVTGATVTVTISKDGGSFGAAVGAAAEIGSGWYKLAGDTTDRATLGTFLLHATAAGADPADDRYDIVPWNPYDANLGLAHLDADVSSRNATTPPTVGAIADAVWDEALSGHATSGTAGAALTSASAAGDPWGTALPGAYGVGTAGKILGTNLDAAVSSRSSHSAADVWAAGTRTLTSFGTLVADIATAVWGATVRTLSAFSFTVATSSDSNVTAIKAKTDNLPASPAAVSDIPTAAQNADKLLGRTIAGSADGGRMVKDALRVSRNKVTIVGTTITVYAEDDSTIAWSGTLTTDAAADPITAVDPA